jgi:O-antigen ligase
MRNRLTPSEWGLALGTIGAAGLVWLGSKGLSGTALLAIFAVGGLAAVLVLGVGLARQARARPRRRAREARTPARHHRRRRAPRPPALTPSELALVLFTAGVLTVILLASGQIPFRGYLVFVALVAFAAMALLAYLAFQLAPSVTLTTALMLTIFNNHWDGFGLPRLVAPDRLVLVAGAMALLLRAPPAADRPRLRLEPAHLLLLLTLAWVTGSAIAAETFGARTPTFALVDRLVVPFAVFALAPLAFRTAWDRQVLLGGLVALGGYIGLTSVFETLGPRSLVFPKFILDPEFGYHGERARGPLVEANANGVALYACGVAAVIAAITWRRGPWRFLAGCVVVVCGFGLLFTYTRAVWLAAAVATVVALLAFRQTRRYAVPTLAGAAAALGLLFAMFPAVLDRATERGSARQSVWERRNVNAAAIQMIGERPLTGWGWGAFRREHVDHFVLLDSVPQQVVPQFIGVHNVFLAFGSEVGLVGAALFVLCYLIAIGGALAARGPPEMLPWRVALLAVSVFWLVMANFAPLGQVFPTLMPWFLAAVLIGARVPQLAPAYAPHRRALPAT